MDALVPLVYDELKRLAASYLKRERPEHTLQPTALVNEAYLRLAGRREPDWHGRAHFYGVAAQVMRQVLVDHARIHRAAKRDWGHKVTLDKAVDWAAQRDLDVIDVDSALTRLADVDANQAKIVELRFFAGLSIRDTAQVLGSSPATVKREWVLARATLQRYLAGV
jgi:RNA polymerase sigma factor (TIGR02999 family)